jgi:bifunctional non-homologous end joining protein LigD
VFEKEGFKTWPKVTGGKGLHIMVPLDDLISHDEAHPYSRTIAERIAAIDRSRYTVSASMAQRPGRLFIDYLRNGRGTTAVGAWSPRARPGFPIAAPVTWRQVEAGIPPDAFTLASAFKNRKRWAPSNEGGRNLTSEKVSSHWPVRIKKPNYNHDPGC